MSNSVAGEKVSPAKSTTRVGLRLRRDSAKSVDSAVRADKLKRKQKKTECQQAAKCDFIHSWLKQSEKTNNTPASNRGTARWLRLSDSKICECNFKVPFV